jgi:DNA polymerase I-like protein with 3'-5' exonuclease and polymerase domains
MKIPPVYAVDFETFPIQGRPEYPPKPVSMSILAPGQRKPVKWLWGHPSGNNCTLADAKRALKAIWRPSNQLVFHNAKFDVDVAETHMGVPTLPSENIHDTMIMAFLHNPHSRELDLKGLADTLLNMPPDERDAVAEWAKKNKAYCLSQWDPGYQRNGKKHKFSPGAYIAYAPGELVAPYVDGDVIRTMKLFKFYWPYIVKSGMLPAYIREQKVLRIFLDNERVGIRVDTEGLRRDILLFRKGKEAADAWLRKRLRAPSLNIDSDQEFAEILSREGVVADEDWVMTATGQRSVAKGNLTPDMFNDIKVARAFGYRNRMQTVLNMFVEPWLEQAERRGDNHISTNWNQVRGTEGGTRTGRPSTSNPNFLNISKTWGVDDGYEHPAHLRVIELPLVRRYLLPDEGESWLHRDYNGQELRLLAHFEDGPLMEAYQENPWLDVHQHVATLIEDTTGLTFARKNVKIANFRIIYGGGAPATASGIGCSFEEAKRLLDAHARALPSIKGRGGVAETTKKMGKAGEPIITWGGRQYYVEPSSYSKKYKRHMTYEYKLLNYACQGSAADVTKQAMINYHEHPERRGRFLVQVYDEMNSSSGPDPKKEMAVLRDSMEAVSEQMDVPMLSEGKIGPTWGDLAKFEEGNSKYE